MVRHRQINLTRSSYWQRSEQPLQSLIFLLPIIVLYEIGVLKYTEGKDIIARGLLRSFFETLGVAGYHVPAVAVFVTLLCWHLARRDPWQIDLRRYVWMGGESILLAVPLFVFGLVLFRQPLACVMVKIANLGPTPTSGIGELLLSLGAGVYEELLFRLIAIALLHMALYDVMKLPRRWSGGIAVAISSFAFSWYHPFSRNPFDFSRFLFYTAAGLYFAAIYLLRGFGIAAGCHAMYDVFVVVLRMQQE